MHVKVLLASWDEPTEIDSGGLARNQQPCKVWKVFGEHNAVAGPHTVGEIEATVVCGIEHLVNHFVPRWDGRRAVSTWPSAGRRTTRTRAWTSVLVIAAVHIETADRRKPRASRPATRRRPDVCRRALGAVPTPAKHVAANEAGISS